VGSRQMTVAPYTRTMFAFTQRVFPLCSTRVLSSSRVMRPASSSSVSSSSTLLSENTRIKHNFQHGRTIIPSFPFSTWRYYSPINYITTATMPISSMSRASLFVRLVDDTNNNRLAQQQTTRGFATKKVSSADFHLSLQMMYLCNDNFFYTLVSSFSSHADHSPLLSSTTIIYNIQHKRVIKQSKGFRGRAKNCFRIAIRRLEKSWQYAYRDRKVKKREFRKLWIQRMNAGVRQYGISYSRYVQMQARSGVVLDRKILSGLAMYEPFSFKAVVDVVKKFSIEGGEAK
jgi:large subunit ribosomal protein L20